MPAADRMHDEVSLGDFGHYFNGFCKRCVVHSLMLHGIQVETHSNPAVVHHRDQVSYELFRFEVEPAGRHGQFVICPVRI
jgi:hypothetical protein